jgi:hypothetical protein
MVLPSLERSKLIVKGFKGILAGKATCHPQGMKLKVKNTFRVDPKPCS